jgi:tRNA dimethylallyltransferase
LRSAAARDAFFVVGPTGVGKSEIAVALAERLGGEIVGADAFQIYAGLDVLSAKPSAALRSRVPHHLIGEVPLGVKFDVAQWLNRATACIADIVARGRVPIVCGGTGLYIRALARGLAALPAADPDLRRELEAQPLAALVAQLRQLDPATTADMRNPRRVVRALEVCILTARPFSSFRNEWDSGLPPRGVFLTRPRAELVRRIDARTVAMLDNGVVEEVAAAGEIGSSAGQVLGLREIRALLSGSVARAECIAAIQRATRDYARRQMTWFRQEGGLAAVELTERDEVAAVAERLAGLATAIPRTG